MNEFKDSIRPAAVTPYVIHRFVREDGDVDYTVARPVGRPEERTYQRTEAPVVTLHLSTRDEPRLGIGRTGWEGMDPELTGVFQAMLTEVANFLIEEVTR